MEQEPSSFVDYNDDEVNDAQMANYIYHVI